MISEQVRKPVEEGLRHGALIELSIDLQQRLSIIDFSRFFFVSSSLSYRSVG